MNLKKIFVSILAGGSLALGGRWVYYRERTRREKTRRRNELMRALIAESIGRLAESSGGSVSPAEAYFFIWVVERVCHRHGIACPDFGFRVRKGMLDSSLLTYMLRRMIEDGDLVLEGNSLSPGTRKRSGQAHGGLEPKVTEVIAGTVSQWKSDFPEEPLVRFGKLFR